MVSRSLLALMFCLVAGTAHAGPVELFTNVSVEPGMPSEIGLKYIYGGGGLFLSTDSGANFGLICYSAIDPMVASDVSVAYISGTGTMYVGEFGGLWTGDKNGCNWSAVPELKGKWVSDITGDPSDPTITYAVTSNGTGTNSIYINDGKSAAWTAYGTQDNLFLNTINVVKTTAGKRIYETAVKSTTTTDPMTMVPTDTTAYSIRVSDDGAKTWTEEAFGAADQYGAKDPLADVRILAIDPTNPDHVVASVTRDMDLDDLIYSPMQGKAGTWVVLAHATTIQAAAFKPDGTLYYGDYDQTTPGLFEIAKLGDKPTTLSTTWKVGCLQWDSAHSRMYACHDWQFGTADLTSGAFTPMLDMRTAPKFLECPGQAPAADRCKTQLLAAYCGVSHYPAAPLCDAYNADRPDYMPDAGVAGAASGAPAVSAGGMSGGGGSAAVAAPSGGSAPAGMGGSAGSKAPVTGAAGSAPVGSTTKKSGCSVGLVGGHVGDGRTLGLALAFIALAMLRVRSSRRRSQN